MKRSLLVTLLYALLVLAVLVVLGVMATAANAQAATETPTPERTPLFVDEIIEIDPGGCDPNIVGDIQDYDLLYQFYCGHCFPEPTKIIPTGTPWPTAPVSTLPPLPTCDPDSQTCAPTQTPEVSPTVAVSVTPANTPEPTPTPEPYYWAEYVGKYTFTREGNATWQIDVPGSQYSPVGEFFIVTGQNISAALYWRTSQAGNNLFMVDATGQTNMVCRAEGDHGIALCEAVWPGFETGPWGPHYWHYSELSGSGVLWFTTNGQTSTWDIDMYYIYWSEDVSEPVPTPEATETPAATATPTLVPGMCNDSSAYYNGEGGGPFGGEEQEGFLPALYIRSGRCFTVIPEASVITGFIETLGLIDGWQGVEVCFLYVGIEDWSFFGVTFNILHFLATGGVLGIVRRYIFK